MATTAPYSGYQHRQQNDRMGGPGGAPYFRRYGQEGGDDRGRPTYGGGGPGGPGGRPDRREYVDGKRVRKAIQRRTVDFNAFVIRHLETRASQRSSKDFHALQPDPNFIIDIQPPWLCSNNPSTSITTKYIHTSTNKIRCPINAVRWTPDGRRLITGASSGEFTLWNGLTFNFETILQAHDKAVRTMVWSHNDTWLITGDDSGIIKYWQSNMNNLKVVVAHKETVRDLSFSPTDGKYASCSDDGTIKIWNFVDGAEERVLTGHGWDVKCIDWHPSKGLLASGSKDNLVKLWDPKTGKALSTLHGHKNTILGIEWNKNGNWLVTASRDQLLRVYDIRTMRELQSFKGHKKEVQSVAWHPHHETEFVSGGSDGSMMFWNVGIDHAVGGMEGAHDSSIFALDWHPMGHLLVSGSNDHTTRFWSRNRPGEIASDSQAFARPQMDRYGMMMPTEEEEDAGPDEIKPPFPVEDLAGGALPGLGGPLPGMGSGWENENVDQRRRRSEDRGGPAPPPRRDDRGGPHTRQDFRPRGGGGQQQQHHSSHHNSSQFSQRPPMQRQQDEFGRQRRDDGFQRRQQPQQHQQHQQHQQQFNRGPPRAPQHNAYPRQHQHQQEQQPAAFQQNMLPPDQGQQILSQLAAQGFPLNPGIVHAMTGGAMGAGGEGGGANGAGMAPPGSGQHR
ncbi:WD40-repeat-containing domain protein [Geranomyces variabilis]|nr:WD40-repeat-containing domain protein [Geranomyces variabilis]KAJ3139922.1 WD repeat-containing protein 33 [Geranomyces variabilis]